MWCLWLSPCTDVYMELLLCCINWSTKVSKMQEPGDNLNILFAFLLYISTCAEGVVCWKIVYAGAMD